MKKAAVWFLSIVMILVGIIILTSAETPTTGDPIDLATIAYEDVEKNNIYYAKELVVMDSFATMDDDVLYMLVAYMDNNEEIVVANMPVSESSDLWDDVNDYLNDDSLFIGDYVIECYVKTETNFDVQNKLVDMFNESVNDLSVMLGESLRKADWRLNYVCDKNGDPYATAEASNTIGKVMGVLCILGALAWLYFGALRKPKASPAAHQQSVYTAPQQPSYGAPQHSSYATPQQTAYAASQRPAAPAVDNSVDAQLARLKTLKDTGFLSEEEYNQKCKELQSL